MMMMKIEKKRWKKVIHTSVGIGGGICCNGKACQENQHHHTCNKRFVDPPFLWCAAKIGNHRVVMIERGIWRWEWEMAKKKNCDQWGKREETNQTPKKERERVRKRVYTLYREKKVRYLSRRKFSFINLYNHEMYSI